MIQENQPLRYTYRYAPTLERFSESNAFIRGLMGPFRSGKSVCCVMEIIQRAMAQTPSRRDGIRRSRWIVVRNCYDNQTEVLTETRGWVKFPDLEPTEAIAIHKDGELLFEIPSFHYQAEYKGEMLGCQSESLDFLVTPDHRLYTARINGRTKKRYDYAFHLASDVWGKTNYEFRSEAGEWKGRSYNPDLFEFLGFWFAEGHANTYRYGNRTINRLVVTQSKYIDYTEKLLTRCSFRWRKESRGIGKGFNFVIDSNGCRELFTELKTTGLAKTKVVPLWIKQADRECLKAFIHGYLMGDGHFRKNQHDTTRGATASRHLADDIQEIAFKAGYVTTITSKTSNNDIYNISFRQESRYRPVPRKKHWYKTDYSGIVYCVEVSSHVIVTRRNNKVSLSSQTYSQLRDTTIRTFHQWFPPPQWGRYRENPYPDYTITELPEVELEINFRALDRPEHIRNLLSLEVTAAWINEAREVPWSVINGLTGRVGQWPPQHDGGCSWYGIIMDTNPPDDDSEWYKFFEEKQPENARIFKQPSGLSEEAENIPHLIPGYYQNLVIGKDEDWITVYVHGQYGSLREGKPVYPEYDDTLHCAAEDIQPLDGVPLILGWDYGLTPACVVCQVDPAGQFRVIDEIVTDDLVGMGVREFSQDVVRPYFLEHYNPWVLGKAFSSWGDKPGNTSSQNDAITPIQILNGDAYDEETEKKSLGKALGIFTASADTGNLEIRLDAVKRLLTGRLDREGKIPRFLLSPKCKTLRKGFRAGYQFARLRVTELRFQDTPKKNKFSHIQDALQNACMMAFGGTERRMQGTTAQSLINRMLGR